MLLYVGNLPETVTDEDLQHLFSRAGIVRWVEVARDESTGRAAGFGRVEMESDEGATRAIRMFDGYEMDDQRMEVRLQTEQEMEGYPPSTRNLTIAGEGE
ncbi:MAG: RNA recognition motif domain-containing protein [Chloroflexota bacterium]|jgi:RNA recognition motif-containing protein